MNGKILINYILSEIIDQFNEILVVTNKKINFLKSDKISTVKDFEDGLGPLGGILTAMKWVQDNKKIINGYQHFHQIHLFYKKELKIFMKILI